MNLHHLLADRAAAGRPVKVGIIGAGRYGTMFLAQARALPGIHVVAVADIDPQRAQTAFALAGWPDEAVVDEVHTALRTGATAVVEDALDIIRDDVDVVVEATGNPVVGIRHALAAMDHGSTSSSSPWRPTLWPAQR